jgi:hypothetical protein
MVKSLAEDGIQGNTEKKYWDSDYFLVVHLERKKQTDL